MVLDNSVQIDAAGVEKYGESHVLFGKPLKVQMLDNLSILRVNNAYDFIPHIPYWRYKHTPDVITLPLWWFQGRARHSMRRMYQQFQQQHRLGGVWRFRR